MTKHCRHETEHCFHSLSWWATSKLSISGYNPSPISPFAGDVSLKMIFSFFTGANSIPPTGYDVTPIMYFNPTSLYPTASTCALQLTIPTCHSGYDSFKQAMDVAFRMHGGFGLT
jgi:hypothetical protein